MGSLVALLLVNHAEKRFPGEMPPEVLAEKVDAAADPEGRPFGSPCPHP